MNHDPYIPLKETFKTFKLSLRNFKDLKDLLFHSLLHKLRVNLKLEPFSKERVKAIQRIYNACATSNDIIVKNLFLKLKEIGQLENSYIIITSDHGELLGDKNDHNLWEHGTYVSVHKSVMKVPLLIFNVNFNERIIKNQVQLKDLFHTVLHMTGIKDPQNKYLDIDKSIIHQINNNSTPEYIFGEYYKIKRTVDLCQLLIVKIGSFKVFPQ